MVKYIGEEDGKPFAVSAALFLFNPKARGYTARTARKMGVNRLPDTGDEDRDLREFADRLNAAPVPVRVHTRLSEYKLGTWEVVHVDLRPSL